MKFLIAIPTYNGGDLWHDVIVNIKKFAPKNTLVNVIDSASSDRTKFLAEEANFNVISITPKEFNHGSTRNELVKEYCDNYDVVIFLTQDAIPQLGFVDNILAVFSNEKIACAYGRQIAHDDANPVATHARLFNYPEQGYTCNFNDVSRMGLKTVFMSNSFSAYRLSVFKQLGGFPANTILCEDMYYTAKSLLAGYNAAYVSNAVVKHSHNYKPTEEFKRYFDIGVFHENEPWIRESFGGPSGEGMNFIISEYRYLIKNAPKWIFIATLNNFMKLIGYKLGKLHKSLPKRLVVRFSMHKRYWL